MYISVAVWQGLISARYVELIVVAMSRSDLEFFLAFSSTGSDKFFALNPLENLAIRRYLLPGQNTLRFTASDPYAFKAVAEALSSKCSQK